MDVEINVGLHVAGSNDAVITASSLRAVARVHGVTVVAMRGAVGEYEGRPETTAVVLARARDDADWEGMARTLSQDSIAVYDPVSGVGVLAGPNPQHYEFDAQYFLRFDEQQS